MLKSVVIEMPDLISVAHQKRKCILKIHKILDWREILTIQTIIVYKTFPINFIEKKRCMKENQAAKDHYNPKLCKISTSNGFQTFRTT